MLNRETKLVNKPATSLELEALKSLINSDRVKLQSSLNQSKKLDMNKFKSEFLDSSNLKFLTRISEVNKYGEVAMETLSYNHAGLDIKVMLVNGNEGILNGTEPKEIAESMEILKANHSHLYSIIFSDFSQEAFGVMNCTDSKAVYDKFSNIGIPILYLDSTQNELVNHIHDLGLES